MRPRAHADASERPALAMTSGVRERKPATGLSAIDQKRTPMPEEPRFAVAGTQYLGVEVSTFSTPVAEDVSSDDS
jgi:hypothetical protein